MKHKADKSASPDSPRPTSRRRFLQAAGAGGVLLAAPRLQAEQPPTRWQPPNPASWTEPDAVSIPDENWRMWPDQHAEWQHDEIYLPEDVDLKKLPVNPPSGGWHVLSRDQGIALTLPSTVEQYFWGIDGYRPYHNDYKFEATDHEVKNGNYLGVSWWWRPIDIPASYDGKQIILHIRGARQRAEVYLNRKLVGYSILEELPFECNLTHAAIPGQPNHLAIRITNPGGEMDWVDGRRLQWGDVSFQQSHGFGGLDRALRLSAHGLVRIEDNWVLNTPQVRIVDAFARIHNSFSHTVTGTVTFSILDPETGQSLTERSQRLTIPSSNSTQANADIAYPAARLWDLDTPNLYWMQAEWKADDNHTSDTRRVKFGFRWFAPEGIGTNALFRLNGRRTRIYTAISWGFWGLNGLWPTPELARREVAAAKTFHLNCLNFHRNVGKAEVFDVQDHEGLLRNMEAGGGKQAVTPIPTPSKHVFSQRYMQAKILHMIRTFRSHPSLTEYILQNEASFDLKNPNLYRILHLMHAEDPSRTIVANDGFVSRSGQA